MITRLLLADFLKKRGLSSKTILYINLLVNMLASLVLLRFFYKTFDSILISGIIGLLFIGYNAAHVHYLKKYLAK